MPDLKVEITFATSEVPSFDEATNRLAIAFSDGTLWRMAMLGKHHVDADDIRDACEVLFHMLWKNPMTSVSNRQRIVELKDKLPWNCQIDIENDDHA